MDFKKNIAVVIVNFNNWKYTIPCIESVLSSNKKPCWVFVIDNASQDSSFEKLEEWAINNLRPEQVVLINKDKYFATSNPPYHNTVTIVKNTENKGYAAGNNIGISLGLKWGADAVWILNNDTLVHPDALKAMTERLFSKPHPGLCGSLICYMDQPQKVQCRAGGKSNKWTGFSVLNGQNMTVEQATRENPDDIEKAIDFIYGASVMASRKFIEDVGPMDERYFLYSEEQDWAYSSQGRFDFAYAANALVFHKEGASTEFSANKMHYKSLWFLTRSRLLLTAKHAPLALPTVCMGIVWAGIRMVWRRVGRRHKSKLFFL